MNLNKRKRNTSYKTDNKSNNKKSHNKNRHKSKSKDKSSETSSSITRLETKEKEGLEVFNMKDITEKLGNSKIYCRDDEKKEILNFIKSKEKNKNTLFV